ncbi:MAG: hypothetical protein KDC90_14130 [Ignavibacteriae bacterium]|nr:hypothetical protein [Ignavibacteriota bacterium]
MATPEEIDAFLESWRQTPVSSEIVMIGGSAVTPHLDFNGERWEPGMFERAFKEEYGYEYEGPASLVVIDVEAVDLGKRDTKSAVMKLIEE